MTEPLSRRPEARTFSVEDLLSEIRRGQLRIPRFQRPFRWKREQIRRLVESIYLGYPIGTLLLWRHPAPAETLALGPLTIEAPQSGQALWVVDGQQRLTSLAGVLLHPPYEADGNADEYRLYFDLSKRSFERFRATPPHANWLPLNVVLDAEQLLSWVESHIEGSERPIYLKAALGLNKALREYQVPTYIVETDDERLLRDIFDRLNTGGMALKAQDIFNALHGGMTAREPTDLHALGIALDEQGLGHLDERWLLRAILAIEGLDVTRVKSAQRQIKGSDQVLSRIEARERLPLFSAAPRSAPSASTS